MLVENGMACLGTKLEILRHLYPSMRRRTRNTRLPWICFYSTVVVPEPEDHEKWHAMFDLWCATEKT